MTATRAIVMKIGETFTCNEFTPYVLKFVAGSTPGPGPDEMIQANEFGSRLAGAIRAMQPGDAIEINNGVVPIVYARPKDRKATVRRRFRLGDKEM